MRPSRPTSPWRPALLVVGPGVLLLALLWTFTSAGCGRETKPPEGDVGAAPRAAAPAAAPPRLDGMVRLADTWLKIGPVVGHDPRMDLPPQCRAKRDAAEKAGEPDVPLCFQDAPRARSAIDTLRLELHPASEVSPLHTLAAADEAAHFIVERNGSIYQLLDLAYAPRRDGAYREGEIRVISVSSSGHDALMAELVRLFPRATIQRVEVASAPPAPASPRAPAPTASPNPDAAPPQAPGDKGAP